MSPDKLFLLDEETGSPIEYARMDLVMAVVNFWKDRAELSEMALESKIEEEFKQELDPD